MQTSFFRRWRPAGVVAFTLVGTALSVEGASLTVAAGGDLQGALNQARAGDTITLPAGATFTGHFWLPGNSGATITLQSSGIGSLPAGQRGSPAPAGQRAKLVTPDDNAVLVIPSGANNDRIQGWEMATTGRTQQTEEISHRIDGWAAAGTIFPSPEAVGSRQRGAPNRDPPRPPRRFGRHPAVRQPARRVRLLG